jgi:hypothetical protein
MIAHLGPSAIFGLLLILVFGGSQCTASDATISWHYIGDGPNVTAFALTPPNPTTQSFITFIAPIDGTNYLNASCAAVKYGFPAIAINATNRTIDVTFSGHASACSYIVLPVSGLEGHVGPLAAGIWSISVPPRFLTFPPTIYWFAVELVPPPLSLQATAGTSSVELSWPASGENYALESTDSLGSGNWQAVTNSPTLSSNTYTLSISANSSNRFFRLHHL